MGPTFTFLAAGLLAAQTPAPTCNCQKNSANLYTGGSAPTISTVSGTSSSSPGLMRGLFRSSANDAPVVMAEERPTFLSRIQGIFGKKSAEPEYVSPEPPQVTPPVRMMQRLPAGQPKVPEPVPAIPTSNPSQSPLKVQPATYKAVPAGDVGVVTNPEIPVQSTVIAPSRPNRISADLISKIGHESDYSWITGQLHIESGVHVIHYATPEVVDRYNGSLPLISEIDLRGFQDGDFVSVRGMVTGGGRPMYRVNGIDRLPR